MRENYGCGFHKNANLIFHADSGGKTYKQQQEQALKLMTERVA